MHAWIAPFLIRKSIHRVACLSICTGVGCVACQIYRLCQAWAFFMFAVGKTHKGVFQMRSMGIYARFPEANRDDAVLSVARLPLEISGWER